MLDLDDAVRAALEQSHQPGYQVSAFYGPDITIQDVPLTTDGTISFAGDAEIQGTGSIYLAKSGESLVPQAKTDPLAPYGQEVSIDRTIIVAGQVVPIPLGRFRIAEVPSSTDYFRRYPARRLSVGWAVQLTLKDRLDIVKADDFLAVTSPVEGNTTWQEIQRLSPIPIIQSLADAPVPDGLIYDTKLDAITTLMANLGGVPHVTREGALTARVKDAWLTATTPVFTINGTIEIDDGMSNDLYNSVAITSTADSNIIGLAEITDPNDPLCVNGPLGRRSYKDQSALVTTQEDADAAAVTALARLSSRQSKSVKVTCLPRPDLELGDFGTVVDPTSGREVDGEIDSMSFSLDATAPMSLTLIVADTR